MTLIEAPEKTKKLDYTIAYSPFLDEEGKMVERYSLVLEADFVPIGFAYATDPSEFQKNIYQWKKFGRTFLPEIN